MNNAQIALDNIEIEPEAEPSPLLESKKADLVKIIEALAKLSKSFEWRTVKDLVFDGVTETLERKLTTESTKKELNNPEIYRLQGQLAWARKYSNLTDLEEIYRVELENINKKIHG